MKQAILLLLHKNFEQARRLIEFFDGQCDIYIHVDKGGSLSKEDVQNLKTLSGVQAVFSKYKVHWAGFSILQAEMYLLEKALEMGTSRFFHLLSGQDYPIRPLNDFLSFFSSPKRKGFLACNHLPSVATDNNTYYRMQYYVLSDFIETKNEKGKNKVWNFVRWQKKHGIKRRIPDYVEHLYGGSAWFSIDRDVAEYLVCYTKKHPAFFRRMRYTYIPEEIYVPSVILNSPYRKEVLADNNCRTILWKNGYLDCSPMDIHEDDFIDLLDNPIGFFSRKFNYPDSLGVLKQIDEYLLRHKPFEIQSNGTWVNNGLDGYEFDKGLCDALVNFCLDYKIRNACDFGCGPGWYVLNMRRHSVPTVGYDANPFTEDLCILLNGGKNEHCCGIADLSEPVEAPVQYELMLFLSVGPFIPKDKEDIVIDNLKRNVSRYLVISWADDRESNDKFVNKCNAGYLVRKICQDKTFVLNEVATRMLRTSANLAIHKKYLLVFQKVV